MPARKRGPKARKPGVEDQVEPSELAPIQELFHGLIRARAREGGLDVPSDLPELHVGLLRETEPRWFAVPGMTGGFAYRLSRDDGDVRLTAESWSRVVGGSGMRHLVTATQVILLERGFV